jgi:hypothetical protein
MRESPPGYRCAFCLVGGCSVPQVRHELVLVPAGSLDDDPGIRSDFHCFVGYQAQWFEITDELPQL